jgi:hypothetical protein
MAVFMLAVVVAGFWPTYFGQLLAGNGPKLEIPLETGSWVVHLHAVVSIGWMLVFLGQSVLAARDCLRTHTQVGPYGLVLAGAVVLMGTVITVLLAQKLVGATALTWVQVPIAVSVSWLQIGGFVGLLALGYRYRGSAEWHKRCMLFGTASILPAAASRRLEYLLGPWSLEIVLGLVVGTALAYDRRTNGHIHPATWLGTTVLLIFPIRRLLL